MYYFPSHTVKSDRAFPMPFTHLPAALAPPTSTYFTFFGSVRSRRKTGRANDRDDGGGGWEDKERGGTCFALVLP